MENVLEYFEETCRKFPDKQAVSMGNQSMTFAEMHSLATRLGARIKKTGTNRPIGVFADRSIEPAVWYLAVLYSGNFYVPIDPDMPKEKIQAIIDDTDFPILIGNGKNRECVESLRFQGDFITSEDAEETGCEFHPQGGSDPAYMVYTSGSTGKPKGVLKSHKAIISYIESFCRTFPFTSDEVIGNQTPFFFDASAKDFYLMLKTGAALEIIPTAKFAFPTELMEYMNEKKITFASWVPTAISIVAQLNPFSLVKPEYLRRLFFVGEVMPMKHLNKWRQNLPDIQYVNLYGQSELAGVCCYYEVKKTFADTDTLPMGKPLDHCRVYLLDGDRVIKETGKIGELVLAGEALATEYYHDEEKTKKCFFTKDYGNGMERCFRTGDLAQYDEDGNLLFASRADFQIKHMGHRIELGEIEAVAGALPEIDRCCCLYNAEKKKIVLFCEIHKETNADGRKIQSLLRGKLSSYMVPGKVLVLEKLPLSPNGKIDRQSLKQLL